jgi:hypothetical protein
MCFNWKRPCYDLRQCPGTAVHQQIYLSMFAGDYWALLAFSRPRDGPGTAPVSAYDGPLSALREHVEDLAVGLAIWEHRHEPDAHARRCASNAVDAIDAMLRELYRIRAHLVAEIRVAAAAAAQADELLARTREDGGCADEQGRSPES